MRVLMVVVLVSLFSVNASSQTGMLKARLHYDAVFSDVKANHGDDVRLLMVMALYQVGTMPIALNSDSGTAELWMYAFLSPSDGHLVSGMAVDNEILGTLIGEVGSQPWPEGADTIYTALLDGWWVDSDSAAMTWRTMAVKDFLESRPSSYPIGFLMSPGTLNASIPPTWGIVAVDGADTLACSLDAYTMEALECVTSTAVENLTNATGFHLDEAYPNPVSAGQFAEVDLSASIRGDIRIEVYDMQGRLTGCVLDERVAPGVRKVIIPSELISRPGVYFIQARSQNGLSTRKLVVSR